jgi:hypothetical protein
LKDLHIYIDDDKAEQLFNEVDVDGNRVLDFDEFEQAVKMACERLPTPYELWTRTLPLAAILADALPKPFAEAREGEDSHLKFVSSLSESEQSDVVDAFAEGVKAMLKQSCTCLKNAYEQMATKSVTKDGKFNVFDAAFEASCGTISNFHEGMTGRVGDN